MKVNLTLRIPVWLDRLFVWPVLLYRKHKFGYPFRRIYLGEAEWTTLDQRDYYRLNIFKWYLTGNDKKFYAFRNVKIGNTRTKMVSMHREIMNAPRGLLVDHRNDNGLDNRRANLRLATHSQNQFNKRKTSSNVSSKFIGVCFDKRSGRWETKIRNQGKKIWLGRFVSEIEAAKAYDDAARKYHGEFARLNFSDEQLTTID